MSEHPGLSDEKARQILGRAAELDRKAAESVSVETLRSAAQEAGISPASFEAALREEENRDIPASSQTISRRKVLGAAAGVLVGVGLLFSFMRTVVVEAPAEQAPAPNTQSDTPATTDLEKQKARRNPR